MLNSLTATAEELFAENSLFEVILWYSLLALSIVILVVFLTVRKKKDTKGVASIQSSIQKEIKMVVSKKEAVLKDQKVDIKLLGTEKKMIILLNEFTSIKEKTSLPDADEIIEKAQKLIKLVPPSNVEKMAKEEKVKYLDKVINGLTFIYGKLDVIKILIK